MNFDSFYSSEDIYFSQNHSGGMVECLEKFQVAPCTALDIGAGEGRNSLYLAANGFNVISVEPSSVGARKIQEASQKFELNINVLNSDLLTVSASLNDIGFVLALTALEHMEYDYLIRAVVEIKRLITPGGYFYAIVFTEEDPGFIKDTENASECAMFIKHYFKKNELHNFFSDFDVLVYKEYTKEDLSHGKAHFHGKAKIFVKKPENWTERAHNQ